MGHWFYFVMGIAAGTFLVLVVELVMAWIILKLDADPLDTEGFDALD